MMSLVEPADESKVYEAIRAALAEARTISRSLAVRILAQTRDGNSDAT